MSSCNVSPQHRQQSTISPYFTYPSPYLTPIPWAYFCYTLGNEAPWEHALCYWPSVYKASPHRGPVKNNTVLIYKQRKKLINAFLINCVLTHIAMIVNCWNAFLIALHTFWYQSGCVSEIKYPKIMHLVHDLLCFDADRLYTYPSRLLNADMLS